MLAATECKMKAAVSKNLTKRPKSTGLEFVKETIDTKDILRENIKENLKIRENRENERYKDTII